MTLPRPSGGELFIVDNSDESWKGLRYLHDWTEIVDDNKTVDGSALKERKLWLQDDCVVWLDKAQTTGFRGVPEPVWNFHIGGYQVCEKWLKDRKGRALSADDIAHYQKIVVALSETIRLMAEIDAVVGQHGGWPLK